MEGSHLPRGPHQRWTRMPPYQRGRTTRRNTRTRGLPRVGLRLRDRLAFVVVFVSPKGDVGRRRGREARVESSSGKREARRGNEKRRQPKGWTMMFLALEFFLPSPGLGCYLILSLSLSLPPDPFGWNVSLALPKQCRFSLFHLEKASLGKQRAALRQTGLAWISGRSRDYNGRDNAYYTPQHGHALSFHPSWEYWRRTTWYRLPQGLTGYHDFPLAGLLGLSPVRPFSILR